MYVRRNRKKRQDGTVRTEIAAAHNIRVEGKEGKSVTKPVVLARLGVEEEADLSIVDGMIAALQRYRAKRAKELADKGIVESPAQEAVALRDELAPVVPRLRVLASKQLGLRMVLEVAWRDLGLGELLVDIEADRCRKLDFERLVFAMVLNRLADPRSKLACNDWIKDHAYMPEAEAWSVDDYYRALDLLEEHLGRIGSQVCRTVMEGVSDEDRRLLLADTTAIFTECAMDDVQRAQIAADWEAFDENGLVEPVDPRPQVVNEPPLRMRGHSKDRRPDAPQVVVGLVATASGQVLWHETLPGNRSDKVATRGLLTETLGRHPDAQVAAVLDSGMAGKPNLAWLADEGPSVGWVATMPIRGSALVDDLLRRPGRWKQLVRRTKDGRAWTARSVEIPEDQRADRSRREQLILVRNPERARRDLRKLDEAVAKVKEQLARSDEAPPPGARARKLSSSQHARLVRRTADSALVLDDEAVADERRRAGVRAIRTTLDASADDVVEASNALANIESRFRQFKHPLRIRPMYHRSTHRIRAHALVCFLALACQQAIERRSGLAWPEVRSTMATVEAVRLEQAGGTWWQRSALTDDALAVLGALGVQAGSERWASVAAPLTTKATA